MISQIYPQLIQKYGTPLYVYDEQIINRQCSTLKKALQNHFGDQAYILYACKANTNPNILKLMLNNQIYGIDAVSPNEVEIALMCGFPPQHITYTANYISDEEIQFALNKGIVLNVAEIQSLERLIPFKSKVIIRLNLDIGMGHHAHVNTGGSDSKFGIHVGLWKQEILKAQQQGVQIIGLHQHMGSKIMKKDEISYLQGIEELFRVAVDLNLPHLEFIDIGGGFGVKYSEEEIVCDLNDLFGKVKQLFDKYFTSNPKPKIMIEPGRYLIAESGYLLCTVTAINTNKNRTFVGTDSGMNHLIRPALYGSYHHIRNTVERQDKKLVTVCGNICESGDILGVDRILGVERGDVLVIENAGAYGYSMASNYNTRGRPAEILIKEDGSEKQIRSRETLQNMLQNVHLID